jgi:hypothetical protein
MRKPNTPGRKTVGIKTPGISHARLPQAVVSLADKRKSKARGMIHARLAGVEREVVLIW